MDELKNVFSEGSESSEKNLDDYHHSKNGNTSNSDFNGDIDFLSYESDDDDRDEEEDESVGIDPLSSLKEKHDSLWELDKKKLDDYEEISEDEIRKKLNNERTVKKPFEKGTMILIFVGVVTGLGIILGYGSLQAIMRGKSFKMDEDKGKDAKQVLTPPPKDEKQKKIDELQALIALGNQGGQKPVKTSPVGTNPNQEPKEFSGIGDRKPEQIGQETSGTNSSSTLPASPPPPPPAPQSTNIRGSTPARANGRSERVYLDQTVPPESDNILQKQTEYLRMREIAQKIGSFGAEQTGNYAPGFVEQRGGYFIPSSPAPENTPGRVESSSPVQGQGYSFPNQEPSMIPPTNPPVPPVPPVNQPPVANSPSVWQTQSGSQNQFGARNSSANSSAINEFQEAEQRFLNRIPNTSVTEPKRLENSILPGRKFSGRLMSPIFALENWRDDTRYPIILEEDIVNNGMVIIPQGTIIMAELKMVLPGGVFVIRGVSFIINNREVALPPDALNIIGRNRPLIGNVVNAKQFQAFRNNILLFLLGGAQSAATLANRPTTTSSSNNFYSGGIGGFSNNVTTQTPPPDYTAAAIQGGIEKVFPRIEAELRRRSASDQSVPLYQVNAGTEVDIYIVKEISF